MSVSYTTALDQVVPLDLTIEQEAVGGVVGKSPTVRVRDGATLDTYLDFTDNTFKSSGWGVQDAAMSEVGRGHYTRSLDLSLVTSLVVGNILVAEYTVNDGGDVVGEAHDILIMSSEETSYKGMSVDSLIRKAITNRQEEFPGSPGRIVLFDDDGTTKILEQELKDNAGGGIIAAVSVPSKRSADILP